MATIYSPFDGKAVFEAPETTAAELEVRVQSLVQSSEIAESTHAYHRSELLARISQMILESRDKFARHITLEAGKPKKLALVEVDRAALTFKLASEEARRFGGTLLPIGDDPSALAYSMAETSWVPRGPVLAITPFNFPLNLVAHKVAPALAVGAPVLLKPPPQAPGAAFLLKEVFDQAVKSIPALGAGFSNTFQVVYCSNELASKLVADTRFSILSFTGSDHVGWMLRNHAHKKKVLLELGGNASVIVHEDANLTRAAARAAAGGFSYAGQVCISVQKIFVHRPVFSKFLELFLQETAKIPYGADAEDETLLVGPMIDEQNAKRIQAWVDEAVAGGAKLLAGGKHDGNLFPPTVLTGTKSSQKISCQEAFGPVVIVEPYDEFDQALSAINSSAYGLQVGVFTDRASLIDSAIRKLKVGGILINEIPTFRADNMPYGGFKDSGMGREGLTYAMREYCEIKTVLRYRG